MGNKTRLITPFLMLLAGAISSIIMYVRGFELTRMLWWLLIILLIFYVLGDVARYLYASIRPRIIPAMDLDKMVVEAKQKGELTGSVVAFMEDDQTETEGNMDVDGLMSEDMGESAEGEETGGYSDEEIEEYAEEEDTADMESYEEG